MNRASIPGWLHRLILKQPVFVFIATAVTAIFWAITGLAPAIGATLIYSLTLGNITTLAIEAAPLPCKRRWPLGFWLLALALLVVLTPVAVTIASAIVFISLTSLSWHSFPQFLLASWKFPSIANGIFGIVYLHFTGSRVRLEARNRELEQLVRSESAEREIEAEELRRAQEIQRELLPRRFPRLPGIEIAGSWEPARQVSGDYYDVIELSKDKLGICIADVVGKGLSAALLMANTQATVRAFASPTASASYVCSRINSVLCTNVAPGRFVTMFYGVLDASTRTLQYTNAGHLRPILIDRLGSARHLENGGALLGVFSNWQYEDATVELEPGDVLLLFTDGIVEAQSPEGVEFGEERLIASASNGPKQRLHDLQAHILQQVKAFCSNRMNDDATLLTVSVPWTGSQAPSQCLADRRANESITEHAGVH
jgi:sigma-B regulation protein RsbU (phosphoserine phosphatase)